MALDEVVLAMSLEKWARCLPATATTAPGMDPDDPHNDTRRDPAPQEGEDDE